LGGFERSDHFGKRPFLLGVHAIKIRGLVDIDLFLLGVLLIPLSDSDVGLRKP